MPDITTLVSVFQSPTILGTHCLHTEHELKGKIFLSLTDTIFSPLIKLLDLSPINLEFPTPKLQ